MLATKEQTIQSPRNTHAQVQVMKCPNCGHDLHFSKRTVYVTCRCGKTYRTQQPSNI